MEGFLDDLSGFVVGIVKISSSSCFCCDGKDHRCIRFVFRYVMLEAILGQSQYKFG